MRELRYSSFDVRIVPCREGFQAWGRDDEGREASVDFALPFSETDLESFRQQVGFGESLPSAGPTGALDVPKAHGGALFRAIFRDGLLSSFHRSLERASDRGEGLRIRLILSQAPELAHLPWEYLYDPIKDRFLALSVATPLVRYLELSEPLQKMTVRPPLRMLVMIAAPAGYRELDGEREWRRLSRSLADLQQLGLLRLERLEEATLPALQSRLRRGDVHLLHFIGHGRFDVETQRGTLILEGETGEGVPTVAEDLGIVLHDQAPRLVVLNTCEGALGSRFNPFSGVAQTLIQQGIPAVVAMQTAIEDDFALHLAHEFYGALADGYPVDACLAEARKLLQGQQRAAWGTPVLYLRAPDGRILDFEPSESGGPVSETNVSGTRDPGLDSEAVEPSPASARWKRIGLAALVLAALLVVLETGRRIGRPGEPGVGEEVSETTDRPPEPLEVAALEREPEDGASGPADRVDPVADSRAGSDDQTISEGVHALPSGDPGSPPPELKVESPAPPAGETDPDPDEAPEPVTSGEPPATGPGPASWPAGDGTPAFRRNETDGQQYAWIPAGEFRFGCSPGDDLCAADEGASDEEIARGFWLGRTEVTVRAYRESLAHVSLMPAAPAFNPEWRDGTQPMVNVSRTEAASFCERSGGRLPTEIEWEYAARAGEERALPADLPAGAWFGKQGATAVAGRKANRFGLYDMLGNAAEWVVPSRGEPPGAGILRGGSWRHAEEYLRFSFRLPDDRPNEMYGFRCLLEAR